MISSLDWMYFEVSVAALMVVALLVGYLFRQRFEYSLRSIFLTCAASSFLMIMAIFLVMSASVVKDLSVPNLVGSLAYMFVFSALAGAMLAGLIVAGAAARQRHLKNRSKKKDGRALPLTEGEG
jgi:vacuolar-type H+-ATPase subunit I/STV1